MSTTVTGSPPGGRTASHRRGPAAQAAPRARRRFRLPRASTTPGKLWLVRSRLVIVCLAWGALATLMVIQHASAAHDVAATDETLSLDAQQIYQSLADADVTVSTAYLYGRTGPYADRVRYQHDMAVAAADLKVATAASGSSSVGASLSTLSAALPVYTGYVEDGQIYNSLGYMARTCLAAGDRPGAIAALAAVPVASSHYAAAQVAAVRILVSGDHQGAATGDQLRQAGGQLARLAVDDVRRQQLTVEILRAALDWCTSGRPAGGDPILGCEPNPRAVRFGLERSYRALARLTPDQARRIELVDLANAIRPRTLT